MTDEEIEKIKEHIEIYARKEPYAIKITEIMRRAVKELSHGWFVFVGDYSKKGIKICCSQGIQSLGRL